MTTARRRNTPPSSSSSTSSSPSSTSLYASHSSYQSPYKPTPTSTLIDRAARWLRLRKYQFEVTYGVYVYTPGEKAVFWTLFCLLFGLVAAAFVLYVRALAVEFLGGSQSVLSTPGCAVEMMAGGGVARNSQRA
ncbi:hypothetical protein F5Y17DRAFT_458571 [Xylariaceae sp. FL0594]|nr:hypothetical protein F5Y17DRAFT_458571 [Xylariaceae sp. FL0594]